jgi:hypothetical protein
MSLKKSFKTEKKSFEFEEMWYLSLDISITRRKEHSTLFNYAVSTK